MIVERAILHITPGSEPEFEAAMEQARNVISRSAGFRRLALHRGIDQPSDFLLLVEWDSVEAHMQGFRESELYTRWRELIGPFFAAPPDVEHYAAATVSR